MKLFCLILSCAFFLSSSAQKKIDSLEFKVYVDSLIRVDTIVKNVKEKYVYKTFKVHFELSNKTNDDLMLQNDTYHIYAGNMDIDCEVETYADDLKRFIKFKGPNDQVEEIREDKVEPLIPNKTLTRKGEVSLYTPLNKKCRIRLVFLLSQYNKNVNNVKSNWITL